MNIPVETSIIWGGDFNFIIDLHLESSGGNPRLKVKSIEQLYSVLNEFDLCDIWPIRNPDKKGFTWEVSAKVLRPTVMRNFTVVWISFIFLIPYNQM